MQEDGQRPWLRFHEVALGLPIDVVVIRLRAALGAKLVAYIANVNTTRVVREWANSAASPAPESETRLRIAVEALGILAERLDPVTVGTWFRGMNPLLGDESPARFIRTRDSLGYDDVLVAQNQC